MSEHRLRGWRAVSAAGLQGKGGSCKSFLFVLSQTGIVRKTTSSSFQTTKQDLRKGNTVPAYTYFFMNVKSQTHFWIQRVTLHNVYNKNTTLHKNLVSTAPIPGASKARQAEVRPFALPSAPWRGRPEARRRRVAPRADDEAGAPPAKFHVSPGKGVPTIWQASPRGLTPLGLLNLTGSTKSLASKPCF